MDIYFESGIALYRSRTKPTTPGLDVAGEKNRCATNTDLQTGRLAGKRGKLCCGML